MRRLAALASIMLAACLSLGHAEAKNFLLEEYFAGKTVAEGSFRAINFTSRKFTVDLTGTWNGRTLTLREDFVYDDGERDTKTWRFTKTSPTTYTGTREDVVGQTLVTIDGNVATFSYQVYLTPETQENLVTFFDRMVLNEDGTVLNKATVMKYGFPVAWTRVDFRRD